MLFDEEENLIIAHAAAFAGVLCLYALVKANNKRRNRRFKVRPINRAQRQEVGSQYYKKIKSWGPEQFFKYTRMTMPLFEVLLDKIKPNISRQKRSDGISSEERLFMTLQFLSQGTSMQILASNFKIGHTTVHKIIHDTCKAIWDVLSPEYLKSPLSELKWLQIASGFEEKLNVPHCLGALDAKHVNIQVPSKSVSNYNYKKSFSFILLAACDCRYRFTMVDIGAYGSQSDGRIFRNSVFGQRLENDDLHIPKEKTLPGTETKIPYFLVADEAVPLKQFVMRPYPGMNLSETQSIFNYHLSRARQMIENSFGLLVARWSILKITINAKIENVDNIVKAVVVLHNYCLSELEQEGEHNIYCPVGFVDTDDQNNGAWRDEQTPLQSVGWLGENVPHRNVDGPRDILAEYFMSATRQVP